MMNEGVWVRDARLMNQQHEESEKTDIQRGRRMCDVVYRSGWLACSPVRSMDAGPACPFSFPRSPAALPRDGPLVVASVLCSLRGSLTTTQTNNKCVRERAPTLQKMGQQQPAVRISQRKGRGAEALLGCVSRVPVSHRSTHRPASRSSQPSRVVSCELELMRITNHLIKEKRDGRGERQLSCCAARHEGGRAEAVVR